LSEHVQITDAEIAAARERGKGIGPRIIATRYSAGKLTVEFENGVTVSAPISTLDEFAFLEKLPSDAELSDVAIWGGGHYVFFPRIDVSLYGLHLMPAHCKEKHDH